jgi:hypothetical protein
MCFAHRAFYHNALHEQTDKRLHSIPVLFDLSPLFQHPEILASATKCNEEVISVSSPELDVLRSLMEDAMSG